MDSSSPDSNRPPNERTPLLRAESTLSTSLLDAQSDFLSCNVPILPYVQKLKDNLAAAVLRGQDTISPLYPYFPEDLQGSSTEMGHFLACLLALREEKLAEIGPDEGPIIGEASHVLTIGLLDKTIIELWNQQLPAGEQPSAQTLESVLWTAYPLTETGDPDTRRVIDYLHTSSAPINVVCHPSLLGSILETWRSGLSRTMRAAARPRSIMQSYDSFGTPRVSHTIHLLADLLFFILLARYLVDPPAVHTYALYSTTEILRDIYILIYSLSNLFFSRVYSVSVFILVILAFLLSYPQLPIPGFFTFTLLTLAFLIRLCQYHLASASSPVFLCSAPRILPLVSIISFHVYNTLVPVLFFFIPVTFFVLILLSVSNAYDLDTRLTFAVVLVVILLLFVFFVFAFAPTSIMQLTAQAPSQCTNRHPLWDRYSQRIGIDARKSFIRCASVYTAPVVYPPPFNLIHMLLVVLPRAVIPALGTRYASAVRKMERVLWRVTIGPSALLIGAVWSYFSPTPARSIPSPVEPGVP